jgi:hypothetical protein
MSESDNLQTIELTFEQWKRWWVESRRSLAVVPAAAISMGAPYYMHHEEFLQGQVEIRLTGLIESPHGPEGDWPTSRVRGPLMTATSSAITLTASDTGFTFSDLTGLLKTS